MLFDFGQERSPHLVKYLERHAVEEAEKKQLERERRVSAPAPPLSCLPPPARVVWRELLTRAARGADAALWLRRRGTTQHAGSTNRMTARQRGRRLARHASSQVEWALQTRTPPGRGSERYFVHERTWFLTAEGSFF